MLSRSPKKRKPKQNTKPNKQTPKPKKNQNQSTRIIKNPKTTTWTHSTQIEAKTVCFAVVVIK